MMKYKRKEEYYLFQIKHPKFPQRLRLFEHHCLVIKTSITIEVFKLYCSSDIFKECKFHQVYFN